MDKKFKRAGRLYEKGLLKALFSVASSVALIAIISSRPVYGQVSDISVATFKTVQFSISEQPLGTALTTFANQASRQIVLYSSDTKSLTSIALEGVYSEIDALEKLLAGTNLKYIYLNEDSIFVGQAERLAESFGNDVEEGEGQDIEPSDGLDDQEAAKPETSRQLEDVQLQDNNTPNDPVITSQPSADPTNLNVPREENEIVVTGTRGSIINSNLEKQLSDSISDILSADQAGRFPDENLAEGLARIPGISFQRQNDTGDGQFISIRGLDTGLNTVLFDGIRAGAADSGRGRRTPLDIITGNNVSSVKVTKSLLPEDPSEGIGGAVDIRTRGPLERSDGFSLSGSLRDNSFDDRTGFRVSARGNKKFANDRFGVNLSVSFRQRYFSNFRLDPTTSPSLAAPLLLTGQDGTNAIFTDVDDLALVPEGIIPNEAFTHSQISNTFSDISRENISISGAVDWQVSDNTVLTFGGRFAREDIITTESQIEFDTDVTDDFLVPGVGIVDDSDLVDTLFPGGIAGLSSAEIQTGLAGVSAVLDDQEVTFEGEIEDEIESQSRLFLRGETTLDNWDFKYVAGWSRAFEDNPVLSIDFNQELEDIPGALGDEDDAIEAGLGIAPFDFSDPTFPRVNPGNFAVFEQFINPFCVDADGDSCGEIEDFDEELIDSVENERFSARFDSTYNFDSGILDYIKFGVQFERSEVTDILLDIADSDDQLDTSGIFLGNDIDPSLGDNNGVIGDFGGVFDGGIASFENIGDPFADINFNGIPRANRSALNAIRNTFRDGFAASGVSPNNFLTLMANENFYSGYLQWKAAVGKLDIITGARLEYYDAAFSAPTTVFVDVELEGDTQFFELPNQAQTISQQDNFEVLPRLALNYNLTDQTKLRFGFSTALARPEFSTLAADVFVEAIIEVDEDVLTSDAVLGDVDAVEVFASIGNPELENSYAYNFDLSFEHYFDPENAISFAAFYKTIDNFIFQSPGIDGTLFSNLNAGADFDVLNVLNAVQLTDAGNAVLNQLGGFEALIALPNAQIDLEQPQNGGKAEVYGVELSLFHTFTYLPGVLSDVGFIGNITLQDTSTDINLGTLGEDDALVVIGDAQVGDQSIQSFDFFNSPNVTGNVALFYDANNIEATLAYRYSGNQFEAVENTGLSQFQRGRGFLDFDLDIDLPGFGFVEETTLTFRASDILDNGRKFSVSESIGGPGGINNLSTFNGRNFTVGTRFTF